MKKKSKAQHIRELKSELRYWQMYRRMYRRWVRDADDKCKEMVCKIIDAKKAP